MEEVWQILSEEHSSHPSQLSEEFDSGDDQMALSVQALNGTEGSKTIRLRDFVARQELLCWWILAVPIVLSMSNWLLRFLASNLCQIQFK
jgi:hypothetical protein